MPKSQWPTFQLADLARRPADVVRSVRAGIRAVLVIGDMELVVQPAQRVSGMEYELTAIRRCLRLMQLLSTRPKRRNTEDYGELSWLAVLPESDQEAFVADYANALLDLPDTGTEAVERLLYDWHQTARAWADPMTRAELTAPLENPCAGTDL